MKSMLVRILSGGQTGADQAAWRSARAAGFTTGGFMPRWFWTEEGCRPEFEARFGAVEHSAPEPAGRTVANVQAAEGTLIFVGDRPGPGTKRTIEACQSAGLPHRTVSIDEAEAAEIRASLADWIARQGFRVLNIAGDRESQCPGIGARVESCLNDVFRRLRENRQ